MDEVHSVERYGMRRAEENTEEGPLRALASTRARLTLAARDLAREYVKASRIGSSRTRAKQAGKLQGLFSLSYGSGEAAPGRASSKTEQPRKKGNPLSWAKQHTLRCGALFRTTIGVGQEAFQNTLVDVHTAFESLMNNGHDVAAHQQIRYCAVDGSERARGSRSQRKRIGMDYYRGKKDKGVVFASNVTSESKNEESKDETAGQEERILISEVRR
jgi:hypothetical protein